jgi:hypothetical protein
MCQTPLNLPLRLKQVVCSVFGMWLTCAPTTCHSPSGSGSMPPTSLIDVSRQTTSLKSDESTLNSPPGQLTYTLSGPMVSASLYLTPLTRSLPLACSVNPSHSTPPPLLTAVRLKYTR